MVFFFLFIHDTIAVIFTYSPQKDVTDIEAHTLLNESIHKQNAKRLVVRFQCQSGCVVVLVILLFIFSIVRLTNYLIIVLIQQFSTIIEQMQFALEDSKKCRIHINQFVTFVNVYLIQCNFSSLRTEVESKQKNLTEGKLVY